MCDVVQVKTDTVNRSSPYNTIYNYFQMCIPILHSLPEVCGITLPVMGLVETPFSQGLHPSIAFKTMTGECGSDNFKRMENWWYSINTNWHQCISKLAVSAVQNRVQCLWSMWGGREDGGKGPHHMCVSLISAITWLAFCKACGHRVEKTV